MQVVSFSQIISFNISCFFGYNEIFTEHLEVLVLAVRAESQAFSVARLKSEYI